MISCKLIQLSSTQHGIPVRRESVVAAESIEIGRGAACRIHLPDHRVDLQHASIKRSEDGTIFIEAGKESTLNINGFVEDCATIPVGSRIEIGPYLFMVENASDGHDIALTVQAIEHTPSHEKGVEAQTDHLDVASLGFSKRKMSLVLSCLILMFFMLFPILPNFSVALDSWQINQPVTLTGSWNPGDFSGGHRVFGAKCSACHQHAFKAVSDSACTACHSTIANHVSDKVLLQRKFKQVRCSDCHADHKGSKGLVKHDSALCVKCHANIRAIKEGTSVADVRDFTRHHSQFRLTLLSGKEGERINRLTQDGSTPIIELPGLKNSHKVHMDRKGVSSPGGDVLMTCEDCHKTDEAGNHFIPMTMKKSCQQSGCHMIYFDEPVQGVVPHGSEHEVMKRLRDFYTKWLAESPSNRAACSQFGSALVVTGTASNCVNLLALDNASKSLFKPGVGCLECHEVEKAADTEVPWKIVPVRINRDWYPNSTFPHTKHGAVVCSRCHDKILSKSSADVSIPKIEICRECHVGDEVVRGKISSYCVSCHKYHRVK